MRAELDHEILAVPEHATRINYTDTAETKKQIKEKEYNNSIHVCT